MAPGGVIHGSFTGCARACPAGRVHRSAGVYGSQRELAWQRPELAAMVGWLAHADTETDEGTGGRRFADADPKTDRRTIPSGRIAHAHTEADGVNRTGGLRFLQIQPVICGSINVRGILPLSYTSPLR